MGGLLQMIGDLRQRVRLLVARAAVSAVNSAGAQQTLRVVLMSNEER